MGFASALTVDALAFTGTRLFDDRRSRAAVVRLSRSAGLPEPLPDALGLSIRIPDAYGVGRHQDLLLVTASRLPVGRHILLPASGFLARPYSTLLPYRAGGKLVVIGAFPVGMGRKGVSLASLRQEVGAPGLTFKLAIARVWGDWTEVATLELGDRLPDLEVEELRFDPSNTGGGLELAGFLNRLRKPAYQGSQEGRSRAFCFKRLRGRPAPVSADAARRG